MKEKQGRKERKEKPTLRNYLGLDENIVWIPSWPFSILSPRCIWRTTINNPWALPLFLYGLCFMLWGLAGREGGLTDKPNFWSCADIIHDSKPQWKITDRPQPHFFVVLLLAEKHTCTDKEVPCLPSGTKLIPVWNEERLWNCSGWNYLNHKKQMALFPWIAWPFKLPPFTQSPSCTKPVVSISYLLTNWDHAKVAWLCERHLDDF